MENRQEDQQVDPVLKAASVERIDKSWTLFLDRDGVINEDHVGWYTLSIEEFRLYKGVKEAMAQFAGQFGRIVICTNQRCIGRGLLTEQELAGIHAYLMEQIGPEGGRIDHFYYAKELADSDPLRKPNPGMALQAKTDYPEIDFTKSVMVGNNPSDMEFAINAGIRYKIFLHTTIDEAPAKDGVPTSDFNYPDLEAFADSIKDNQITLLKK